MFLNLLQLYGQSKAKVIKNIDTIVTTISSDSTIQKVIVDRIPDKGNDVENSRQPITVFLKDNKILKISYCNKDTASNPLIMLVGGIYVDYYLENEELRFVNYRDEDYSRPSSCGYVSITHKYYFKNDKLLKSIELGNNPCKPLGKFNKDFLAQSQLSNFKKLFEIVKNKKRNH